PCDLHRRSSFAYASAHRPRPCSATGRPRGYRFLLFVAVSKLSPVTAFLERAWPRVALHSISQILLPLLRGLRHQPERFAQMFQQLLVVIGELGTFRAIEDLAEVHLVPVPQQVDVGL